MCRHSKATSLVLFLSVLVPTLAFSQGENFRRLSPQGIVPGQRDFSSTTSTVVAITREGRLRVVTGYDDFREAFDANGAWRPGSSAMGYAYSDDSGDTWRRGIIRPPNATGTVMGSPSLAVTEPAQRGSRPTRIYYAAVATSDGGGTNVVVSASDNAGESFSRAFWAPQISLADALRSPQFHQSPSICIYPTGETIDLGTRERTQYPLGRVALTYINNQGTDRASIQFAVGTPNARGPASNISWGAARAVEDVDAADRPYMRHPVIQRVGGRNVIIFEIHRPIPNPSGAEDRELQLVAMEEYVDTRTLSRRWRRMANQPNDGRAMRFASQTTRSNLGYHPANNVAMMSFKAIPTEYAAPGRPDLPMPASGTGLLVWAGKEAASIGWQTIHFQQLKSNAGVLTWEPRVELSNQPLSGMAFQPTVGARWDLWAVSWFQQNARTGRVQLVGKTRSGSSRNGWRPGRNLTAIPSGNADSDMPVCATSSQHWGSYISSVVIAQIPRISVLTLHADSRRGECSDYSRANSVRFQEVGATRWSF